MNIAVRIKGDEIEGKLCYSWEDVNAFFFSPMYDDKYIIPLKAQGKTYTEKKESIRQQAQDFQNVFDSMMLYWSDIDEIGAFFERNGKRYGLLKEFRENGIC